MERKVKKMCDSYWVKGVLRVRTNAPTNTTDEVDIKITPFLGTQGRSFLALTFVKQVAPFGQKGTEVLGYVELPEEAISRVQEEVFLQEVGGRKPK
jgi:hypothetical protein